MTDQQKQEFWFLKGKEAKRKGFERVSPFYENSTADYFFFCGFDGTSFEEAQQVLKERIEEILKQDPTIVDSMGELQSN